MQFTSLKLAGFKSFVDPSEFLIETGVTGIVGPNGCGKSNLLEALRWVMGANSAKAMRAGAMDDVIFSGTSSRPARNHATVVLTIDNAGRSAPSQFNNSDILEISRRINRGVGSNYHINGKPCRAKDVQLLFADASTGANSPALVRQGQINELIAAKPQNRRRVLEEAAGISGLHTRRHEAELRLRAAETNLSRLDDIGEELQMQHQQLKRQVRIASRYRNLASEIRALESFALLLRWTEAKTTRATAQTELAELQQKSGELASTAARALAAAEAATDGMEELRREQAIATALVARLAAARESVERDEREAKTRNTTLGQRVQEIIRDIDHENQQVEDATNAKTQLQLEQDQLDDLNGEDTAEQILQLETVANDAIKARELAEASFEELMAVQAQRQAQIANAENILSAASARAQRLKSELDSANKEMQGLPPDLETLAALSASEEEQAATFEQVSTLRASILEQERQLTKADEKVIQTRHDFDTMRRVRDQFSAEQAGLKKSMLVPTTGDFVPVSEDLQVTPGFELALAAALGDDLEISLNPAAPAHWKNNPSVSQPLPEGALALSQRVTAPSALNARLSQIGVVEFAQGEKLSAELLPGQRLVSDQGHLWRWDGLQISADAPSAAALRLQQKNRLEALEPLTQQAEKDVEQKRKAWLAVKDTRNQYFENIKARRQKIPALEQTARRAEAVAQELRRGGIEREARYTTLREKIKHWTSELAVAQQELKIAETQANDTTNNTDETQELELQSTRQRRDQLRKDAANAEAGYRAAQLEIETRKSRLKSIQIEIENWQKRIDGSSKRIASLASRQTETEDQLQQASVAPNEIDQRRKQIFAECETAEHRQAKASDALALADSFLREAGNAARAADSAAAEAREIKAGLQARLENASDRLDEISLTIRDTMGCDPEELQANEHGLRNIPRDAPEAETRLHKLRAERENIGGVNLQAEQQAEELSERLTTMAADRDELTAAIAKLRKGVDSLNHEGRTRLLAAFETINNHFKSLFLTLFGGGEAELRLTESDDPLQAGLDIFACPPGKKMQNMSLMSGGEQALTAMALIFAVFLSNPAPVCVLDEVDAPLDDANVERFCAMLDEMRTRTQTRFIVITHNALTMSRLDRLYGVTMAERGVSQLVSVDLQVAEGLIAAE